MGCSNLCKVNLPVSSAEVCASRTRGEKGSKRRQTKSADERREQFTRMIPPGIKFCGKCLFRDPRPPVPRPVFPWRERLSFFYFFPPRLSVFRAGIFRYLNDDATASAG